MLAVNLIADLDTAPDDSFPSHFTRQGDALYFFAADAAAGRELWKTDGTVAGTSRVIDLYPGPENAVDPRPGGGAAMEEMVASGGRVYFTAARRPLGVELFRTDGTAAGTAPVKAFTTAFGNSYPFGLTDVGGRLYFLVPHAPHAGAWVTDGTEAGTTLLAATYGVSIDARSRPTDSGGSYYFVAETPAAGSELWKSDGTPAGTAIVKDLAPGLASANPGWLTDVDGTLYFVAANMPNGGAAGLWRTDGTAAGTVLVKAGVKDDPNAAFRPANVGRTLYFVTSSGLWKTDGTAAGTAEVLSSQIPGSLGVVRDLTAVGNRLFFVRQAGAAQELWTTDGTTDGTVRVAAEFPPTSPPATLGDLAAVGGRLYFTVAGPTAATASSRSLWTSDGTPAGTVRLAAVPSGPADSVPAYNIAALGDGAFFPGYDPSTAVELWRSDGTPAGTARFKDLNPANRPTTVWDTAPLAGDLVFSPHTGDRAGDLLRTVPDGQGLLVLRDGTGLPPHGISEMAAVGDTVFFASSDSGYAQGLWKTDGTAAGTRFLSALDTERNWAPAYGFTRAGDALYFVKTDISGGARLWTSDGTPAGTVQVGSFWAAWTTEGQVAGGAYYFTARPTGSFGNLELWKAQGSPPATVLVADLAGGTWGSVPRNLTALGDWVLFAANSAGSGGASDGVWRSDGTAAGTVRLTPPGLVLPIVEAGIGSYGGYGYFGALDATPDAGGTLWKTDGTPAGTSVFLRMPAGVSAPDHFAVANGLLFFRTIDGAGVSSLWRSDGTAAGTVRVRAFDSPSRHPLRMAGEVAGRLLFAADGDGLGYELWQTDGTEAGTRLAADVFPGADGSHPHLFTRSGDNLYFLATDPVHGRELRKYTPDAPAPAARVVGRHVAYNDSAFDGNNGRADPRDHESVAPDKRPLLPGGAAEFSNVTSYAKGINGVMVDVAGLRDAGAITARDFVFEKSGAAPGAQWAPAAAPTSISVSPGAGAGGSHRVTLLWSAGAVKNGWLRVTVKANADTGLAAADVFSFGSLVGETGSTAAGAPVPGEPPGGWRVDAADVLATRRALSRSRVGVTSRYDFDRDGVVNVRDYALARSNQQRTLAPPPGAAPVTAAASAASKSPSRRRAAYDLRTPE